MKNNKHFVKQNLSLIIIHILKKQLMIELKSKYLRVKIRMQN